MGFLLLPFHRNISHGCVRARDRVCLRGIYGSVWSVARAGADVAHFRRAVVSIGAHWLARHERAAWRGHRRCARGRAGGGQRRRGAAIRAHALGANVSVLSRVGPRLARWHIALARTRAPWRFKTDALIDALDGADLVIGAINAQGGATPKLIDREHLRSMGNGAVLIDIGIDGGGIAETSRETPFDAPDLHGRRRHSLRCINIPSAVPRSATLAYSSAVLTYAATVADLGAKRAVLRRWPRRQAHSCFRARWSIARWQMRWPANRECHVWDAASPWRLAQSASTPCCRKPNVRAAGIGLQAYAGLWPPTGAISRCPPGAMTIITALAALLGRPVLPLDPECGDHLPHRVALIDDATCIGCAKCLAPCPTDAILGADKFLHRVVGRFAPVANFVFHLARLIASR